MAFNKVMNKLIVGSIVAFLTLALAILYTVGTQLIRPTPSNIVKPETNLPLSTVSFRGEGNIQLKGWFIKNPTSNVGVLLMHGNQSNRLSMLSRAKFLYQAGYSVMLFDLRAHGASEGEYKTFGYLEAKDAELAISFFKRQAKLKTVGIIGTSLGGAATVLSDMPLPVEAIVIESVYPAIEKAIMNRLTVRMGKWGAYFEPLLTYQLPLRLGVKSTDLQPVKKVVNIMKSVFVIGGEQDTRTTLKDTQWLYNNIRSPQKSLWIIPGVGHANFHHLTKVMYEKRVLSFLNQYLPIQKK
ncbi:alpha/beta fold hydrolase [Endozoicomonas sp. SM1973]|uniref:Alpha/beta fold hydrolase n=1 Tax=Spartinivicinus marinus TaxID=2994442 RepID=A0A853I7J5_9GAMM|nr:alpha/beta fold hydrolase [Spartinivicinus marinus]MCX4027674.1 alpha/beta fold hydrolase [Spartinivicinus marinus]NYZ66628.1 alpha/beta fold hydrolase [Spartinivicinus marinus]